MEFVAILFMVIVLLVSQLILFAKTAFAILNTLAFSQKTR